MWQLKSGEAVLDRADGSHIHEGVGQLLPEVLSRVDSQGREFFKEVVDIGRVVGTKSCVVTGPGDEIVYAQRPHRDGHTRFVKNRESAPCSCLTVVLERAEEGHYVLKTAFVGDESELESWHPKATEESREFWSTRALVWGSEPIIPGTETTDCPW